MPWCPNCKTEYQEGFTQCKDCKVALVDKLEEAKVEFIPFLQSEDKKITEKLVKFFQYSDLDCEMVYDEEYEVYTVLIPPYYETDARKLYEAFYLVESDMNSKELSSSPDAMENSEDSENAEYTAEQDENVDELPEASSTDKAADEGAVYIMKADEYKDLAGTVAIFLVFGIGGLVFIALNIAGIFHILNGWLPNTVMGIVFLLFLYVAFATNKKAKKVRSEIDEENIVTKKINDWMNANVTEDFLASLHNENISDEANYIKYTDTIKEKLIEEFGPLNLAYLDRLIDEFYTNHFENEE